MTAPSGNFFVGGKKCVKGMWLDIMFQNPLLERRLFSPVLVVIKIKL